MSRETTLLIKGAVSELPEADQENVRLCYSRIMALINEYENSAILALALAGSELEGE